MHKPHSERPKMPGLPRRRPDAHPSVNDTVAMPRTVPILPTMPPPPAPNDMRPSTRHSWSKSIVDQAQRGEIAYQEPAFHHSANRPVRSQAAARARAGEAYRPVTPLPAPMPAPAISVNSFPAAPAAPEVVPDSVTPVNTQEIPSYTVDAPESTWTRIRKGFGSLLGALRRD